MPHQEILDHLLKRVRQAFPDVTWKSARVRDEGWDHYVLILDDSVVFRLPKDREGHGYFHDEIEILQWLADRISVQIPSVTHISGDKTIMGYSYLPGEQLDANAVEDFDEDTMGFVSRQLALFLSDLHDISPDQCSKTWISKESMQEELESLRSGFREHLQGFLPEEECEIIEKYIQELQSCMLSCSKQVFLHGDLGLEHVLLDREKKEVSIIDFSDWIFGDPAIDFSGLYDSPVLATEVFRQYRHKKDCDGLLARAAVYNKLTPISMMIDSFRGYPCEFDEPYKKFKRVFGI